MAIFGVGKNKVQILCQKADGKVYSIVALGEATLTRTPNAPACLKLKIRRNEEGAITPENGEIITLTLDEGHDMFWGYIVDTQKEERNVDIVAYDQLWYWNRNTYSKNYGSLSASDLYIKMADDFGFSMVDPPTVVNTEYVIPNIILENAKPIDIMTDALNITYEHTGVRFYIYDAFNNLCLSHGNHQETLKVNTLCINHLNCKSYTYEEDIENTYNVIKVHKKDDKDNISETVTAEDSVSAQRFGKLEYSTTAQDGEDLNQIAKELLKEKKELNISLHCSDVIGDPRVFGGSSVFVDFFTNGLKDRREFIRGWFKVESVTHKISNATHYMDLDLSLLVMLDEWDYEGLDPQVRYDRLGVTPDTQEGQ